MTDPVDKALALAVRYLARRARSRFEMAQYLARKQVDPGVTDQVLEKLGDFGYLDDREFARQFIEDRVRFKPKSTYALAYELRGKGIDEGLALELLAGYQDQDLAIRAVEQRMAQWRSLDPETRRKKVMNYLRYRGFSHSTCIAVWETCNPLT